MARPRGRRPLGWFAALVVSLAVAGLDAPRAPAAAPAPAPAGGADEIATRRAELQQLKQQLDEARAQAHRLRGRERRVLAELDATDKQLSVMERYVRKLEEQEQALGVRLRELSTAIDARQADLDASHQRLTFRIRQIYKQGQPSLIEVVFTAESLPDLFRRIDLMMRLADEEKQLMADIEQARTELLGARRELEQSRLEVQLVRREKAAERGGLVALRAERRGHLERIRSQRQAREAAVTELAEAEKQLEKLIGRLEAEVRAGGEFVPLSGPFAGAAGKLPWPVRGPIITPFGPRRGPQGTVTRCNGVEIKAAPGTPVRAVADGRVVFRDWLTGYGNSIILNHGSGYYTFYAHASEVLARVGQTVASGDIIARVGDTSSLAGPALHFEVRKGAQALDPAGWLSR